MNNFNIRAYFAVIGFAFFLTVFAIIGIQQDWGLFRRQTLAEDINAESFNLAVLEEGAIGVLGLDLFFTLLPPSSSDEVRDITIELTEMDLYVRDDHAERDIEQVCIEYVDLLINYADLVYGDFASFLNEPTCYLPTLDDFVAESQDFGGLTVDNLYFMTQTFDTPVGYQNRHPEIVGRNFWYPFDGFQLDTLIDVVYTIYYTDGTNDSAPISPYMQWDIQASGTRLWNVDLVPSTTIIREGAAEAEFAAPGEYDTLQMQFRRPLLYRMVMPFFIVLMVLLIGLVPLLGDRDTLVDICAAMLFGIFGLKGILGPGDQMGQTILDIALIGLYVVLAFAAALFFLNKIRLRRQDTETDAINAR